jgi:hypothetical protein
MTRSFFLFLFDDKFLEQFGLLHSMDRFLAQSRANLRSFAQFSVERIVQKMLKHFKGGKGLILREKQIKKK